MEYGAILPNNQPSPLETYQGLQNQEYNRSLQMYRLQQEQQDKQFQIAKYVGDKLDPSTYGTGMDTDILANKYAHDAMQELTGMIQNNVSPAEIAMRTAQHAGYLSNYAEKARMIDANAKAFGASLSNDPSINANKAYNLYKWEALHDGNGGILPIDKIDPTQDYSQSVLDKYGDHIVKGPQAIDAFVKGQEKRTINPGTTFTKDGVKYINKSSAEYYPSLQDVVDGKGNVINEQNQQIPAATRLRSKQVVLPNGQTAEVADDGVYNQLTQSTGTQLYLRQQAKLAGFDPDSQMGQIAMQRIAQEYLHNKKLGYFMPMSTDVDNSQQEREANSLRLKYVEDNLIRNRKQDANQAIGKESPFAALGKIASGNFEGGVTRPDGKIDVTNLLPGATLLSGKTTKTTAGGAAAKDAYNSVLWDPATQQLWVEDTQNMIDEKTGKPKIDPITQKPVPHVISYPIGRDQLDEFITNHAYPNGASPEKAKEDFHKNFNNPNYNGLNIPAPEQAAPAEQPAAPTKSGNSWLGRIRFGKKKNG